MNDGYVIVALGFLAIAAAGMMKPFLSRRAPPALESPPEDQRVRELVRSLRALEREHREGEVAPDDYDALKATEEARLAHVLADEPVAQPQRPTGSSRRRIATGFVLVLVLIGASVPALRASIRARDANGVITGDLGPGASARGSDPLAYFEDRVRMNPNDIAARLDLAHRYLDTGDGQKAVESYLVVLGRDPNNAEALAHVGFLLFESGRTDEALTIVKHALQTDPKYPEGLLIEGLIILRGKRDPSGAIAPLEAYLSNAPYGGERDDATKLLQEARAQLAKRTTK